MSTTRDALTTPFSLSVLTATKGNASKRLIPDAHGRPIRDPAHSLGISGGGIEHVRMAGLRGLRDLLARIQHNQVLVHGIPKGSEPGDIFAPPRSILVGCSTSTRSRISRTKNARPLPSSLSRPAPDCSRSNAGTSVSIS